MKIIKIVTFIALTECSYRIDRISSKFRKNIYVDGQWRLNKFKRSENNDRSRYDGRVLAIGCMQLGWNMNWAFLLFLRSNSASICVSLIVLGRPRRNKSPSMHL